ncbi:MAG: adenylate/guanylate cyclase domain-containing protein [Armatimonadota bacterium]
MRIGVITGSRRPCSAPGTPVRSTVGSVLTEEARKVVTILFTDLVGSTGLTERLDAEEVRDVVGKFYRIVQHAVERFGGRVANLLGDAVLAIFGLPLAHEDDPERAVRAAFAIRDALPALNDHLQTVHSLSLAVRLGLTTGEVVAASGSTFDRDFLVSDAVTTAARLQQTAAPGAIIVGERTHRLTRDVIEYRPLPPLEVKGKAEPLAVWEAMAPLPERLDMRRDAAPLVGRHGEMGILRFLYHRCRDDSVVHLATITGQAGVGKSRLVREFLAEVRDDSPAPLILRGRSLAFGSQIGYHALIDILRSQSGLMDTDPPEMVLAKLDAWLREAAPDHHTLLESLLLMFGGDDAGRGEPGHRALELRCNLRLRPEDLHTLRDLLDRLASSLPDELRATFLSSPHVASLR